MLRSLCLHVSKPSDVLYTFEMLKIPFSAIANYPFLDSGKAFYSMWIRLDSNQSFPGFSEQERG